MNWYDWFTALLVYIALILDKHCVTLPGEDRTFLIALTGENDEFVKNIMKIKMENKWLEISTIIKHPETIICISTCFLNNCMFRWKDILSNLELKVYQDDLMYYHAVCEIKIEEKKCFFQLARLKNFDLHMCFQPTPGIMVWKRKNSLNIPWGCFHSIKCFVALMSKLFWEKLKKDVYQFLR